MTHVNAPRPARAETGANKVHGSPTGRSQALSTNVPVKASTMSKFRRIACVLVLATLAGCASQVTRTPESMAAREPVRALTSFEIAISPAVKASMDAAETQKFDVAAFRAVIQRTLDAARLMAPDGDFKLTVTVDELRVRSTFNAIMWGFMAGSDTLNGTATLTRLDGRPAGSFKVGTSYALGGFAGGQDNSRVVWLYEEFAKLLTKELVALRDQPPKAP